MGVPVTGTITTTGSGDTYATTDPLTGIDSWRAVADHTARNAIPALRRRQGMAVWTQSDSLLWTLNASPWAFDDTDWTQFTGAGLSVLTTLGDILYFSTVNARLAGNITTTKKYLSQTGAGASSAAPVWAQVAFADLSGSVAAAQLPNPSASTLGGVQSAAAVSHQFITSISTSGVPVLAQPAFADISGTAVVAQLPTIGLAINQHSGSILTHSNTNGTVTLDLSQNDWIKVGPVTGNFTLATANTTNGQQFTVILSQQNGNSNFSVTWFSGITWVGTPFTAPVMPSTNSAILTATFKTTGTGAYLGWWLGNSAT